MCSVHPLVSRGIVLRSVLYLCPCFLDAGVKFVLWLSYPSQTCRFTLKRTQRRRLTSVLTARSPLRTRPTWPSTCAYTWAWNLTAVPTVRNVFDSSPTCSSTQGWTFESTLSLSIFCFAAEKPTLIKSYIEWFTNQHKNIELWWNSIVAKLVHVNYFK